ncbi:MAG TPA: methyltransferase [Candidatus Competibacteraceae bacterium]|nr:methyltransferase [Candidatus Competibacteraceae bacterium]
MSDPAFALLARDLAGCDGCGLWLADDNIPRAALATLPPNPAVTVLSNRYDLWTALRERGWDARFADFDGMELADACLEALFYRVSKEKPLVHHVLNLAARLLKPGGRLYLAGLKSEGIQTYIDKARALLGERVEQDIRGSGLRRAVLGRIAGHHAPPLDDRDYGLLRPVAEEDGRVFWSKPGVFGWDKIDQGSRFLVEYVEQRYPGGLPAPVLDLGCGYGYLAVHAARLGATRVVATDNNAAAVRACRHNFALHSIAGAVIAADCGAGIAERFPLILCNPPFHQGFAVQGGLTEHFLAASRHLLAQGGTALFVVNRFIPLERKAAAQFRRVETVADNGRFKLIGACGE